MSLFSVLLFSSNIYCPSSEYYYSLIIWIVPSPQYYYSLRIFAGQEPSAVWVGWVTPDYHMYDPSFDLTKVRNVTITVGDDRGNIHDRSVFIAYIYNVYQGTSCTPPMRLT